MEKRPAEYWIKHLGLVEHPGEEDGYFAVPFEDTFSVRNSKQVRRKGGVPGCHNNDWFVGEKSGGLYCLFPTEEGREGECQGKTGEG